MTSLHWKWTNWLVNRLTHWQQNVSCLPTSSKRSNGSRLLWVGILGWGSFSMCGHQSMRHQTDPQTKFVRSLDEGAPVLSLAEAVVQSGSACKHTSITSSVPYPVSRIPSAKLQALRTTLEQIQMPEAIAEWSTEFHRFGMFHEAPFQWWKQ